jgi:hypothetical protein
MLLLAAPLPAPAEVPGQDAPAFAAALGRWLADDEAALPEFAALAAGGNRAAQVLLALIDARPELHGPWLAGLDRAARIALLRRPGGLSGQTWMEAAAEDTPLARLWLARLQADTDPEVVLAFAALGEHRAGRDTVLAIAARQHPGIAALADAPGYPPGLRFLAWRAWRTDPARAARIEAEIAALPPGDPQIAAHRGAPAAAPAHDAWLATAPLAAPLRAFCTAACPVSATACARATFVLGGDLPGLARLGTPSETLIPAATWDASSLGRAALLRRAEARDWNEGPLLATAIAGIDACTAEALARETARFLP